ncbi:MAG: CoA-disulfide reductase [Clostridiales bacterium]|nr:CoA-disulfide reductase [Clostridiales bacterium]
MSKKVLIVGGVAGGASAATRLRRLDEKAQIILFERDEYISFANCGLPYYIGETIKERDHLLVQTPEAMRARFNIDVRVNSEVIEIHTENKTVTVNSKEKGRYEERYDYLILSPGAKAIRPKIPGIHSNRIHTLRNIPDTDRIKCMVDRRGVNHAVVIGGGFIGVEMAENLKERGLDVTLVEAAPHILAPFDSDMVVIAEEELTDNGVDLILGDGVKAFEEVGNQVYVTLNSGRKLSTDLVVLAIGVTPDTGFLKGSGIALGERGHILVNERMETNIPGIYAVGDAILVLDYVTKEQTAIPLAGPANKQGRIAADNVAGLHSEFNGSQGSSILKILGLTAASTGANERTLKARGISYQKVIIHPVSHASYYPGAMPMTLKLLFDEEGKVLGAQGIGYEGVDKRIDVIATVIRMNGTVYDLAELELAYAPPFSSAKDPVNMAGFVAQNVLEGRTHVTTWDEVEQMEPESYTLLDVRCEIEYMNGHIQGAINIPLDDLRERLGELDKNKIIVVYCQVGLRGYLADRILSQYGFQALNVTGGYLSAQYQKRLPQTELHAADVGGRNSRIVIDPDTQVMKEVDGNVMSDPQENKTMVDFSDE